MRLSWMQDAAVVAVSTGLRESELFSLSPPQIDLAQRNAWITHEGAKSGYARAVPLNEDACAVLERRFTPLRKQGKRAGTKALVYTRGENLSTRIQQNDRRDFHRACQHV